jgi:hypothetical protein
MWTITGPVSEVSVGIEEDMGAVLSGVGAQSAMSDDDGAAPDFSLRLEQASARWRLFAVPPRPERFAEVDDALLREVVRVGASAPEQGAMGIVMSDEDEQASATIVALLPQYVFDHLRGAFADSVRVPGAYYRIVVDLESGEVDTDVGIPGVDGFDAGGPYLTRAFSVSVGVAMPS